MRDRPGAEYEIVEATPGNVDALGFCGYSDAGNEGHRRKCDWLRKRFAEGLRLRVLRSRRDGDVGMIEYVPAESSWRPVSAPGYMVIHCIMVLSRHKGRGGGRLLLDTCLEDAKASGCRGVAVVTSTGSFMAGAALFLRRGFRVVERQGPYALLAMGLGRGAAAPCFTAPGAARPRRGLVILASDQCPMVPKWTREILAEGERLGLEPRVVPIETAADSRALGTPYGMFSIVCDGEVLADRPVSATRFSRLIRDARAVAVPRRARHSPRAPAAGLTP